MKKTLSIIGMGVISLMAQQAFAQSPFIITDTEITTTTAGTEGSEELIIPNKIRNVSASPFKFNWRLINPEAKPATWELSGFCDNNTCYTSGWQAGEVKESFDVLPGEESDFKLQMRLPVETAENGTASFRFEAKVGEFADTATFIVTKSTTGVELIKVDDSRISIFPNPNESNHITVYIAKELQAQNIKVFNLMGQLVLDQVVSHSDEFNVVDVNQFSTGLHIIHITNENNKILSSRKFIKR